MDLTDKKPLSFTPKHKTNLFIPTAMICVLIIIMSMYTAVCGILKKCCKQN